MNKNIDFFKYIAYITLNAVLIKEAYCNMGVLSFSEIKKKHFDKRCKILSDMSRNRDILSFFNCALIDKDKQKIDEIKNFIDSEHINYKLHNISLYTKNKSRLKIVYLIPHNSITGGIKILIEQSNKLSERGHDVLLYSHFPKPDWINCISPYFLVHPDNNLCDVIPCADVVVAGYWDLVVDALRINAPLKYHFAQGDFDIFEFENLPDQCKEIVKTAYTLPLKIITVSSIMEQRIKDLFGRMSTIIPNAINKNIFFQNRKIKNSSDELQILLVGSDCLKFKGHATIIGALYIMKEIGYKFKINWITPVKLSLNYNLLDLDIKEQISPSQEEIGDIYRASDIYICGSYYESFSLPPLEAMTCGCIALTSDNGGIRDYSVDGYNSIIFRPGDVFELVEKLRTIIEDPDLRLSLKKGGLDTSKKYSWAKSIRKLEREFKSSSTESIQARRY
jgi:glycosyltransferase involved in cell wall biosynthesis